MRGVQAAGGTAIAEREAVPPATAASGPRALGLRVLCMAIGVGGLMLDQFAKTLAIAHLDPQRPVVLLGGLLTLQLIRNPGAAFSMGEDFTVVLTGIAIAALIGVLAALVPVSYTHLDVYKRQRYHSAEGRSLARSSPRTPSRGRPPPP